MVIHISDEKRRIAPKQARPEGLRGKWRHTALRDWQGNDHYLRPTPCGAPPGLAPFDAATQLANETATDPSVPLAN